MASSIDTLDDVEVDLDDLCEITTEFRHGLNSGQNPDTMEDWEIYSHTADSREGMSAGVLLNVLSRVNAPSTTPILAQTHSSTPMQPSLPPPRPLTEAELLQRYWDSEAHIRKLNACIDVLCNPRITKTVLLHQVQTLGITVRNKIDRGSLVKVLFYSPNYDFMKFANFWS